MGETALRITAELHDPKVVKLLLEKGAPTDVFDNEGFDFSRFVPNQRRLASDMIDPAASEGERNKAEEEKRKILEVCALLFSPPLAEGPSQVCLIVPLDVAHFERGQTPDQRALLPISLPLPERSIRNVYTKLTHVTGRPQPSIPRMSHLCHLPISASILPPIFTAEGRCMRLGVSQFVSRSSSQPKKTLCLNLQTFSAIY